MSIIRKNKQRALRKIKRVRQKFDKNIVRITVFRSLNHIYAQAIDDNQQKTLASCSSLELKDVSGDKKAVAHAVGRQLAQKALKAGINKVAFDRGSSLYHGRIKALAEGMREAGLHI